MATLNLIQRELARSDLPAWMVKPRKAETWVTALLVAGWGLTAAGMLLAVISP